MRKISKQDILFPSAKWWKYVSLAEGKTKG